MVEMNDDLKARRRATKLRHKFKDPTAFAEKKRLHDARYRASHKEQIRSKGMEYRERKAAELKISKADYYAKNKAEISARVSAKYRSNYQGMKDKMTARSILWRAANLERVNTYYRDYRQKNLDRLRETGVKNQAARRVRIKKGTVGFYSKAMLLERDGKVCYLCEQVIDMAILNPRPMSFSVDHVKPIVSGGWDTFDNVASTHLRCNMRKGEQLLTG